MAALVELGRRGPPCGQGRTRPSTEDVRCSSSSAGTWRICFRPAPEDRGAFDAGLDALAASPSRCPSPAAGSTPATRTMALATAPTHSPAAPPRPRTARTGDCGAGRGVGRPPAVDHRPVLAHSIPWTRPRPPQPDLLPGHRTWPCGPPGTPPVRAAPLVDGTRHALLLRRRRPDADHRHTHPRRRGPDRRRAARVPRRRPATPARGRRPTDPPRTQP